MKFQYFIPLILLLSTGCKQEHDRSAEPVNRVRQNVEVEKATLYAGLSSLQYSGLVEAKQNTPLSFKSPGTVVEILVEEGQQVKKGQLLAKLDASNSQNSYELAQHQQAQAQDAYDRMKPMYENGTLPAIRWVEVETGLAQAKTAAKMAQRRIEDSALYAPKSGVIGNKSIEPGMNVLPSAMAFELLDINTVYVNIPVPENEVGKLQNGQSATIEIAALGETRVGAIQRIGVVANPVSHTYPVKIAVSNEGWKLKPGMVCNVRIASTKNIEGVAISNKALQRNARGQQFVYVLHDSTVMTQLVETIDLVGNQVIVNNLPEGELVVTSGQHKLTTGSVVNIVNPVK